MAEVTFTWDGQSAGFDLDDLTFGEAAEIERVTGGPLRDFRQQLADKYVSAVQVAVFIAFKRERPDLRLADLDGFKLNDVKFDAPEVPDDEPDPQEPGVGPGETN